MDTIHTNDLRFFASLQLPIYMDHLEKKMHSHLDISKRNKYAANWRLKSDKKIEANG